MKWSKVKELVKKLDNEIKEANALCDPAEIGLGYDVQLVQRHRNAAQRTDFGYSNWRNQIVKQWQSHYLGATLSKSNET